MSIACVYGPPGSAKTALLSYTGLASHRMGRKVLANFSTPYALPWNPQDRPPGTDFLIMLDEAGVVADGRMHASEFNKHFTRWLVQVRKIDSDLMYSCQFADQPDRRLRMLTDIWFEARFPVDDSGNILGNREMVKLCMQAGGTVFGRYYIHRRGALRPTILSVPLNEALLKYDSREIIGLGKAPDVCERCTSLGKVCRVCAREAKA